MMDARRRVGQIGEDIAAARLAGEGHAIVARNWRTRAGEIDIVTTTGDWLVFVEVRTRRLTGRAAIPYLGAPEDSVTPRKQMQLVEMAEAYLHELPWAGRWRIDVIAIELRGDGSVARLEHLIDAVQGAG